MCYVFYGDDLSIIVWNNFYYDGCIPHVAINYHIYCINLIINLLNMLREYLSFSGMM